MKYSKPLFPFLLGCILFACSSTLFEISWINACIQMLLFSVFVFYPIWKTEKLSFVDIGWPWGLVCIGITTIAISPGYSWRIWGVGLLYIFMGARMGFGAIQLWRKGYLQQELPRYRYQRLRWERHGKTNTQLAMQVDAMVQGLANASFLAFPLLSWGLTPTTPFQLLNYWGFSFGLHPLLLSPLPINKS